MGVEPTTCRLVAARACAPLDFQRLIPKIPLIALSELPPWLRGYLCLLLTVRSVGPKRFRRSGEKSMKEAA